MTLINGIERDNGYFIKGVYRCDCDVCKGGKCICDNKHFMSNEKVFKETEGIIDGITVRHIAEHKYLVPSNTEHHKIYEIDLENKDNPHPNCTGFEYRKTCSHWKAVIKHHEYHMSLKILDEDNKQKGDIMEDSKKDEKYYIKEIAKLICIIEQSRNSSITVGRTYVLEKLNMIIKGSGIGIHPSLEGWVDEYMKNLKK